MSVLVLAIQLPSLSVCLSALLEREPTGKLQPYLLRDLWTMGCRAGEVTSQSLVLDLLVLLSL